MSELDLWLYAGELLEIQSAQSRADPLPLKDELETQPLLENNAVAEKRETTAEVSDAVTDVAALPKLLERLAEELAEQQAQWFPIMPPSTNLVLTLMAQPTPTLMQVSELMDGLVSEKRDDYTVYPVTGMERENKGVRERIFYNRKGELLGVVPCESDYNPSAWVENKYSDLYERDQEETDWLKNVYDPRRLNITFDLTLARPEKVSKSRISSKPELASVPVRRSGGTSTNLSIGSIQKTGDTVKVTVVYPSVYTNRIDIYSCTDLVAGDWTLRHTTDIEASTNFVEWEDADCTNWQMYAAGNADYDGDNDGVSDAREIFINKTDPADPNDPPSIAGIISYSGFQTNTIKVIAVTDSNSWASEDSVLINQPGAYRITDLSHTGYWVKAFRDLNGDGLKDFMEASGSSLSIVEATGTMSGVNFALTEPDTDSDGFSEYEELVIFKTDPNDSGDQYPQGTGTSVTVYYGHPSISSTDWVYGTSAFYLYDEVSMGKGWIVGDEFVPDLHQESSTIYYGQPDYSDCPDTFVYAPDAFMNNDVSMGKGWAAQKGFVTDFRQASQQINYAQPDYFGHRDLYVYTYTANAYSEMVGKGWLRPGSFVPDLTELSHLVYWGLPSYLPQTNITKDSFILATSSLDDDVMQGTGWATPDGFLSDLSSGVGPVYYGNPVGYSNIWVFGRSSFDLDNDEQIGIGWVNLYDFITYDEPDTDLDDDNQMDGYNPFDAEGYTPPNDSLTANLNLYIHDTSSFSERYALSVGPFLAVMPGTGQLAEASGQVERGTVYEDAYIESLPDGDDDGDYNAHVTGYGIYADDPNGYLGDKTDTGFNSGKRYFDVYFPLTGISGYRPGLKTSPGSAVSRVHEDDPRYLVVMVNDDNDDGGASGHHDYDDTVIGTNDNDIVKLTLEQFLPTALTKGTLELTVSPSNTIRLYRSNGNLLSNYTLNLANKQGDLYYLTAMDIDLYAEALTNCTNVTISLAYKTTNGVEVCRDEVHLAAISVAFDHAKVNTRNLTHPQDDFPEYDHCVAFIWAQSQTISLTNFVTPASLLFTNYFDWYVNDVKQTALSYNYGSAPGNNEIQNHRYELKIVFSTTVVDRLIAVEVPYSTLNSYTNWYAAWLTNTSWLEELPAAYSSLATGNTNPEPATCTNQLWDDVGSFDEEDYYHPGASFEMRSVETPGGHGHQACYTDAGVIITSGVSSGTADYVKPDILTWTDHRDLDVLPFVRAAQLDGNPVSANDFAPDSLDRPMMYEGSKLQQYLQVRPPVPNSKELLTPNECGE
ncbi:MAG: hypothetical protein AB7T27_02110 [Kiritimatiellia bacterium]